MRRQRPNRTRPPARRLASFEPAAASAAFVAAMLLAGAAIAADNAKAPAEVVGMAVSATTIKKACFTDSLVVMGHVVARNEVLVRPDRDGLQISEILAEVGDTVSSTQTLARLSSPNDQQNATATVRAPIGGLVLGAPTVVGEMASARGDPLFRIVADGEVELSAEIPAKQVARISAGQLAKVKLGGMDELPGRVRRISTTVDASTQLGEVRITLPRNPQLRVGAFGRATINAGESCGVSIPLSALLFGPDGAVVQTIRNDRIETRRVTVGLSAQSNVQIRDGLTEGDLIVVRAGAFLREGDHVRPVIASQ